ncbi:MAG: aryl-sulfate sulfotransferase [Bacteroidota bacterium]
MKLIHLIFFCVLTSLVSAQFALPPAYAITKYNNTSKGYYFLCAIRTDARAAKFQAAHIILDAKGHLVYFKYFAPGLSPGNLQVHKNGQISYYQSQTSQHIILNNQFQKIDSLSCANGYNADGHAFEILENGHHLILATETVKMDLSGYHKFGNNKIGGSKRANVKAGIIQELDEHKKPVFEWHSIKHFSFMDIDEAYLNDTLNVDWMHFNALVLDDDGNYLVSARNFNEISKVNKLTGDIIWRFGGKKNQFKLIADSVLFVAQHDIRKNKDGTYSLYDNGKDEKTIHSARAKAYRLNEKKLIAETVWEYTDKPGANSYKGLGNVQCLENGNYLINYGSSNVSPVAFNVVDANYNKVFEVQFNDTLRSYRAFNYLNLPWQFKRPNVMVKKLNGKYLLSAESDDTSFHWSTGQNTREIEVFKNGRYQVFVPYGEGGFIGSEIIEINTFIQ